METVDAARTTRRNAEAEAGGFADLVSSPFRIDRDRIAGSPFFARLSGVTQVVSTGGSGLLHNRLTHSLKVAQVARAIAERLGAGDELSTVVGKLGGCDPDVVEAAALGHDLGHPPFGHLGEQVLDRIARRRYGLSDGFEGNAQTFRIVTTTEMGGPTPEGLNLTAATRAALLKYPWLRLHRPEPHPATMEEPPRGAAEGDEPGTGSAKFSAYVTELDDADQARAPFTGLVEPWQQTIEASVMDLADDIAYAIHDLQDFHRIGVLQHASVATELGRWLGEPGAFAALSDEMLREVHGHPGRSLETLRRRLHAKDAWIADDAVFAGAVARVQHQLVDGLLANPFDGSVEAEQAMAAFSASWTARLAEGVLVTPSPTTRSGHVTLRQEQWHEVQVLKFVHRQFVLQRPDFALHQRGQAALLTSLVDALDSWLGDRDEADRLPRKLHDLVTLAAAEYEHLVREDPDLLVGAAGERVEGADAVRGLARGRAVVDFVASLTDAQAASMLEAITGRGGQPWSDSFVL